MGLHYPVQTLIPAIVGSKDSSDSITTEQLESAYHADTRASFACGGYPRVEFMIQYTMGATEVGNSIEWQIEASNDDGDNWFMLTTDSTSSGISTVSEREFAYEGITDAGDNLINAGLDIAYTDLRIQFKETGVNTNKGGVYCEALLSGR